MEMPNMPIPAVPNFFPNFFLDISGRLAKMNTPAFQDVNAGVFFFKLIGEFSAPANLSILRFPL
jgi:hypothetical protein